MIDWQLRFRRQLVWTKNLRDYLFDKIDLKSKSNLLEIGCGPGELLKEIGSQFNLDLYGIDLDGERISLAEKTLQKHKIKVNLIHADFLDNQFEEKSFDIILTNYLFMWVSDLKKVFIEIHRILKNNGILLILGEPDYGGLIEYPDTNIKNALYGNFEKLGADPEVGRKLNQYFHENFQVMEKFCLSIPWIADIDKENLLKEVEFFGKLLEKEDWNPKVMKMCVERGNYFMFIPTFSYHLKKEEK